MNEQVINDVTKCNGLSEFAIVYNGSAGIESPGFRGVSHLIEHCMCEKAKDIEEKLSELGINWNAFTTDNEVVFFISGLAKNIPQVIPEFMQSILTYDPDEVVFNREKNIVLTEYNMHASDQWSAMDMNLYRKIYNYYKPIGCREDLEKISYKDFIAFKKKWFNTPSYVVYTHPENEKDLTIEDLNKAYPRIAFNNVKQYNRIFVAGDYDAAIENNSKFDTQRILQVHQEFSSNTANNHLMFTYAKILNNVLTFGLKSVLMQEIREKLGYVYGISASIDHLSRTKFVFTISTMTQTDKIEEVTKRLKDILANLKDYLTEKKYQSIVMSMKSAYERTEFIRSSYSLDEANRQAKKNIIENVDRFMKSYNDFIKFVDSLKLEDSRYYLDTDFITK